MEIGKKIHQFRKLSGISQEQLAEKLNVSRQTISKWETGATLPDIQSIVKFCNIFQVTLNDLLLDEKNTNLSTVTSVSSACCQTIKLLQCSKNSC